MKYLFTAVFSIFLLMSLATFQNAFSQTEDFANEEKSALRSDLKSSDFSAYVNIKKSKNVDRLGTGNCETNVGGGYCLYLLTAEIKQIFKGKAETKTLEFYTSAETSYPKKNLLGEKIVFLAWGEDSKTKKKHLTAIENSSRGVRMLDAMRKIADPTTPVNDADDSDPYSLAALKNDFKTADAVIFADVKSFREDAQDISYQDYILQSEAVEIFKGNFKTGDKIEYLDDWTYRAFNQDDLGKQVIFLEKNQQDGKTFYTRIKNTADFERNGLLEKLRKIAGKSTTPKSSAKK